MPFIAPFGKGNCEMAWREAAHTLVHHSVASSSAQPGRGWNALVPAAALSQHISLSVEYDCTSGGRANVNSDQTIAGRHIGFPEPEDSVVFLYLFVS